MYLVYKGSSFWQQEAADSVREGKKIKPWCIKPPKCTFLHCIRLISVCHLRPFPPSCVLPPICLWLGQVGSICARKTDESRRQQQGAVTGSCSQVEWFLAGVSLCHGKIRIRLSKVLLYRISLSAARMLCNKVEWTTASCCRPRCISFGTSVSQMMHVAVSESARTRVL